MSWYVIQTYTGSEEKLTEMIRRIVPRQYYGECFVIYSEQLRHRQQENQIHILRLFPGYIFISSNEIEQLFRSLKGVPAMSRIMAADDFAFTPLCDREAEFLLNIMDTDHVVRLSYVATDGRDHVTYLSGPLEKCRDKIQSYRFRKRYAAVRLTLDGHEKEVKLGIILNDDVRRETAYGKVEAPIVEAKKYTRPTVKKKSGSIYRLEREKSIEHLVEKTERRTDSELPDACISRVNNQRSIQQFTAGTRVLVVEGIFRGSTAIVNQAKKDTLKIFVQMFGRDISAEVPMNCVKRIW